MADEVHDGLTSRPRQLPSKYFYDERGSRLFERITELPEYYLTRAEQALLDRSAADVARIIRPRELVELGAGSAKKTRTLIEAGLRAGTLRRYVPVEVSQAIAERTAHDVSRSYPELEVHAVVGDFEQHLGKVPHGGRRLVALLGSTIGNFTEQDAVDFLRKTTHLMSGGDALLLGTDLVKDEAVLEAAYNDSQGVTAKFNANILNVVNRHLGGDFDPDGFEHVAYFNPDKSRVESYLRARSEQAVRLDKIDLDVQFDRGEMISTEVSCKYTRRSVEQILARAGLTVEHWFADSDRGYALSLSRLSRTAPPHRRPRG